MKDYVSRRGFMKEAGISVAVITTTSKVKSDEIKLAIDRSNADWGDRPMYLRAYHPPYLVYYYGAMRENKITNKASIVKWRPLVNRVENEQELKIRFVEAYDDACAGCQYLTPEPLGSVWGVGYSCTSFKKSGVVKEVTLTCRSILGELGLYYGSEILLRDLVLLLEKNVPVLYEYIGGNGNQEYYEKGLKHLKKKYEL